MIFFSTSFLSFHRLWHSTIFETTHRKAVRTVVVVHVRITPVEVQVLCVRTRDRRPPIVAVRAFVVDRTIGVVTVARYRHDSSDS